MANASSALGHGGNNKYQTLEIGHNRVLGYREWGDPYGEPVFYAHGTPGSSMEGAFFHQQAKNAGLRWIVLDRPGIGNSSLRLDLRLSDYSQDVTHLTDHLGIGRFAVVGWSSGVPHSMACVRKMPDRINYAAAMAGYTNFGEMRQAKQLLWSVAQRGPKIAEISPLLFRTLMNLLRLAEQYVPTLYLQFVETSTTGRDKALLRQPDIRRMFLASQDVAFKQGVEGAVRDLMLQYADWGFSLKSLTLPVDLYQGTEDRFVPWQFACHMAEQIPQTELSLLEGEGHMFPLRPDFQQLFMSKLYSRIKSGVSVARKLG